jgi:hypothetical protein
MKKQIITAIAVTALMALAATSQASLAFQLGNTSSGLTVGTSSFNFTSGFTVNSEVGGTLLNGLTGSFTSSPSGAFTFGSVTQSGNVYTATVNTSPSAVLNLSGLTADVAWITISTSGANGGLGNLSINVNNISYAGSNADLQELAAIGSGILTVSFNTTKHLGDNIGAINYTGSYQSVPEPSTVVAGALLILPFGVSTMRILRKSKVS